MSREEKGHVGEKEKTSLAFGFCLVWFGGLYRQTVVWMSILMRRSVVAKENNYPECGEVELVHDNKTIEEVKNDVQDERVHVPKLISSHV